MFNILCELHFWSQKDGIIVNNLDFGAFVYQDRKSGTSYPIQDAKKRYCEGRGIAFSLHNKRPKKLRDALAEFEEVLYDNRVVRLEWKCSSVVRAVFDGGLQTYVKVNLQSGDPEEFVHDKFVIGKLASNYVSDVAMYSHHAVFAFTDNHLMHAYLSKPSFASSSVKKWNVLDVKLQNVELSGPSGRRLDKVLSFNVTGDMILMWWKCSKDEVYPWSPQVKAEDRANVHIYSVNGTKFDLLCFYRTKFDPVSIVFSKINPSTIYTIQQRVTDDGEVTLEWENATLDCRVLQNNYSLSLPLSTHVSALALSPREDKLLATCIDGSVLVADSYGNVTNRVRTNLIPNLASWHPDGALIVIGNNKGQLQWFDSALSPTTCQLINHDAYSSTLDIGSYFKYQPNLVGVHWNRRVNAPSYDDHNDFLLLHFEKGPLVGVKLFRPREKKLLSAACIAYQYLTCGAYSNALNLLHTIDWEMDSELAMATMQSIVSFLMRQPLSPTTENAIEKALGFFLNPIRPIPDDIASEVVDGVLDLAKRFFHLLIRYQCFDKAFRLAIDLNKRELFMDLHHYCKDVGNHVMAAAAWERADDLLCSSHEDESSCDCSESHTSSETSSSSDVETDSTKDLHEKIVPPLPIYTPLESARNKLGYSSILQQHNYRRNPPNIKPAPTVNVIPNRLDSLPSHGYTKSLNDHSPSTCVTDYLNQHSLNIGLSSMMSKSSLIEDNCLAHHSNIPSSRAPLQFNTISDGHRGHFNESQNEKKLCSKVLSIIQSDQSIEVPQTLKVANVRRKNIERSNCTNEYMIQSPPKDWPSNASGSVDPACSRLHHNAAQIRDPIHSYNLDRFRPQPDGLASTANFSEPRSFAGKASLSLETPSLRGTPKHIGGHLLSSWNSNQSTNYKPPNAENHQCSPLKSTLTSTPDVIDVTKKCPEQPIVASAETEDGKIKVVHFGLV